MKKLITWTLTWTLCLSSYGQNIVPNGSFETPSVTYSSIGFTSILYNCFLSAGAIPPDDWVVLTPDPDRMKEGTIYCNYDNDLAQDGDYYAVLNNSEDIEVTLDTNLIEGCLYQFSCYLNLETMRGTRNNPSVVLFFFYAPDGNTIQSPIISWNVWQYFATPFISSANSTKLEIKNWVAFAGMQIDNIQVVLLGCPLPVEYLYIRTKRNVIEWATASERNSERFEIINHNGQTAKTLKAAGNTTQNSYYKAEVKEGLYIIRQVDIDGRSTYSKMIRVSGKEEYEYAGTKYNLIGQEVK